MARRVGAKVWAATVAPAVVEAVAAAMRIPERGASTKAGMFMASSTVVTSYCRADALIMPAIVPVPISRMETPMTLLRPNSVYSMKCFALPVAIVLTAPPTGSAMRGSIAIPARGRRASMIITTAGPRMAGRKPGSSLSPAPSRSAAWISSPFFFTRKEARTMAMTRAQRAGMILRAMTEVRGCSKASETAMVLGLGEMILPALPPPIMATRIPLLERPARLPMASAMGATVITEISTKTPTAQMIIVAAAMAATARFSPSFSTMVSAIFSADPVLIRAPASIPLVRILKTEDIMDPAPLTMVLTVTSRPPPPMRPPIRAPKIRL